MSDRLDRRRFLWMTAAAAATALVAACAPSAPRTATKPTEPPAAQPAQPTVAPAAAKPTAAPQPTAAALGVSQQSAAPAAKPSATTFKEAPELAQLVKDGKLPPVEQRLPTNPRVVTPLQETGQYRGPSRPPHQRLADSLAQGHLLQPPLTSRDPPRAPPPPVPRP